MNPALTVLLATAMLAGCAVAPVANSNYSLVDPKGVDMGKYQEDYAECAQLANQTDVGNRAAAGGAGGAVFGAVLGGLLGAAICGRDCASYGAGIGAASGVVQGAAAGGSSGVQEQQVALRRCLAGRGYTVIR